MKEIITKDTITYRELNGFINAVVNGCFTETDKGETIYFPQNKEILIDYYSIYYLTDYKDIENDFTLARFFEEGYLNDNINEALDGLNEKLEHEYTLKYTLKLITKSVDELINIKVSQLSNPLNTAINKVTHKIFELVDNFENLIQTDDLKNIAKAFSFIEDSGISANTLTDKIAEIMVNKNVPKEISKPKKKSTKKVKQENVEINTEQITEAAIPQILADIENGTVVQ